MVTEQPFAIEAKSEQISALVRIERRVQGRVRNCSVAPWKFFFS